MWTVLLLLLSVAAAGRLVGAAEPRTLTSEDFKATISSGNPTFVKFFAPWCGHCQRLAPTWDALSEIFENTSIIIAKVDCTQDTAVCSDEGVRGYPTLKLFIGTHHIPYAGQRNLESLQEFVLQHTKTVEGDEVGLVELDDGNFVPFLEKSGVQFVKFYAPWCGHCQRLAPVWDKLATFFKSDTTVHIGKIDCTRHPAACTKYGVQGYPTLLMFGGGIVLDSFKGERSLAALISFVREHSGTTPATVEEKTSEESDSDSNKGHPPQPLSLTADNFDDVVKEGVTFVEFFAPWCGHCKLLAPTWEKLAEMTHATSHTTIAKVDCTVETELCNRFDITGYPTLLLFSEGVRKEEYNKARDLDSLLNFIKEYE